MKKTIFITVAILLLFSACNKYKEYPEFLTGEWVCQEWRTANNSSYLIHPTDSTFIIRFGQHNQQTYCSGIHKEGSSKWMQNTQFNYQLEDNIITISGKDENGNSIKGELEIKVLTDSKLIYRVTSLNINQSHQKTGGDYVLYRTGNSFKDQLINSIWSGLYDDETFVTYTFSDQTFEFTYGDLADHFSGNYFLYGNLLVLNYTSDPVHYECWQLSNVNSKLNFEKWIPLNNDGSDHLKKRKFSLTKSS